MFNLSWSQYRPDKGKYTPDKIDPFLCTHILFAFAKIDQHELKEYEWNDGKMSEQVIKLKEVNPDLKVLLALGGWNHGSGPFSQMVAKKSTRQKFIKSTLKYLIKVGFDGLDLDWEYPGSRDGAQPGDKQGFTLLVKELKEAFQPFDFILSAAVSAAKDTIDKGYEIPKISQHLDFITVMAYDYHGMWENFTGHYSPLYSRKSETGTDKLLNADWSINYWLSQGAPPEKLVLGLGTYGRVFKLVDPRLNQLGSPAIPSQKVKPISGKYTRESGYLSYYEICTNLKSGGWTKRWSSEQKVPYAFKNLDWVGYDDIESIKLKARYANKLNLSGISFWSLDLDDFSGEWCSQGKYPLFTTAIQEFLNPSESSDIHKVDDVQVQVGCRQNQGYFVNKSTQCKNYYVCYETQNQFEAIELACQDGLRFDLKKKICDFLVDC